MDETPPTFIAGLVVVAAAGFLVKAIFNLLLGLASVRYIAGIEVKASRRIADYLLSGSLGELRRYSQGDIQYAVKCLDVGDVWRDSELAVQHHHRERLDVDDSGSLRIG